MTANPINLNQLAKFSKLLAQENLNVQHDPNAYTASFDVKRRTLTLPMWQGISKPLYHMLIGHEVGHAKHTTPADWENTVKNNPRIKNWLNVIEDARIEKLMKRQFPGLRPDFREGYKELFDRDFFKLTGKDLEKIGLGNRVNVYYKLGHLLNISFSRREQVFINAIDRAETFAHVIRIAEEILKFQDTGKIDEEFLQEFGQGDENDDPADQGEPGDGDVEFGDDHEGMEGQAEGDENGEDDPSSRNAMDPDDEFSTLHALEQALKEKLIDPKQKDQFMYVDTLPVHSFDASPWIIPHATIAKHLDEKYAAINTGKLTRTMRTEHNSMINYLVKEFLINKAADGYSRIREAKTGVLHPNKLHAYKMVDDIFKRNAIIPDSKSHGMMMFIDFSSSMSYNMYATLVQLYNLVMFCRKVSIPHRVYAFTSVYVHNALVNTGDMYNNQAEVKSRTLRTKAITDAMSVTGVENMLAPSPSMSLLELFHENMTLSQFNTIMESLLWTFRPGVSRSGLSSPNIFSLGGTPLDDAVVLSAPMLVKFKRETNKQNISVVYLTDGGTDSTHYYNRSRGLADIRTNVHKTIIRNYRTKTNYTTRQVQGSPIYQTSLLCRWINDLGFTTVNYFVGDQRSVVDQLSTYLGDRSYYGFNAPDPDAPIIPPTDKARYTSTFKKEGCVAVPDLVGADLFIFLAMEANRHKFKSSRKMASKAGDEAVTKGQLAKNFAADRGNRINSRQILKQFIKEIA